jgi:protein SCO1
LPTAPAGHLSAARLAGAALAAALGLAACVSSAPAPPSANVGTTADRAVPAEVARVPLVDQAGRAVNLASFRGRIVVLAPFLTLCQEICPLTTANLVQVDRALDADHLAGRVEIIEVSEDPARDSPARLAAYAQMTSARHELVTGSPTVLADLARFFGWYYGTVPEPSPPGVDWWTGQPLAYDVTHSDGFYVIDASGHERFASGANPSFRGELPPRLANFLSAQGRMNTAHPDRGAWTPSTVLQTIAWLLHRPLTTP